MQCIYIHSPQKILSARPHKPKQRGRAYQAGGATRDGAVLALAAHPGAQRGWRTEAAGAGRHGIAWQVFAAQRTGIGDTELQIGNFKSRSA